jgi:hypothetical protein
MQDVVTVPVDVKPIWVNRLAAYHPDGTMPRGSRREHWVT